MEQIIIKYLRGNVSDGEKQMLWEWIRKSESNKKEFIELRNLWITSGHLFPHAFDGTFYDTSGAHAISFHGALPGISDNSTAFNRFKQNVLNYEDARCRKKIRFLNYAASVAVFMICSLGMYLLGSKTAKKEPLATVINQVIVRDDKTSVTLPDGTNVYLNKGSKISYTENFTAKRRVVTLNGEGFFDVVCDDSHPFFVETNGFIVKVLGTEFDVKNYAADTLSEITLLSGKIEVYPEDKDEPIRLSPHQKIAYNKQTGLYHIEKVDALEYALWKNEKLVMDNETLDAIFRKMERWYNVDIVYDHTLPVKARYSITITDEPKEEILRLLSIITPIKYKIENDKIIIKRK
jgi:ferric-dicitrate binding protein FerR (iron transport regulator)